MAFVRYATVSQDSKQMDKTSSVIRKVGRSEDAVLWMQHPGQKYPGAIVYEGGWQPGNEYNITYELAWGKNRVEPIISRLP